MEFFDFFARIKLWVKEHNTTIEALLSGATGNQVTKAVYQGWKKRKNIPSGEFCYKLAKYMNVSTDWLISGIEPASSSEHILKDLETLDPHDFHVLEFVIHNMAVYKKNHGSF
ncbi:MAG: helix-turn-helix transcriptional regulator [Spirochaetales bacterium]|nr:helix-turn-helix transcriptional regulator [Spirochaetales bacterium]